MQRPLCRALGRDQRLRQHHPRGKYRRTLARRVRRQRLAQPPARLPRRHDHQDIREVQRPDAAPRTRQKFHRLRQQRTIPGKEVTRNGHFEREAIG